MDEAKTIALGGHPAWKHTFDHPEHGPLTFSVEKLPTNRDWLNLAVASELAAPGVQSGVGAALAEAIAGLQTIIKRPEISREEVPDPDDSSHVKVTITFYEPLDDQDMGFVTLVWATFMNWRAELLSKDTREQVKNSSGATNGLESVASSPDATDSRSPILA
jgi:hypothetical protein